MKTIELLLTESVDNLGIVGDVVKVRPGYARNFLLPRGMATTPTQGNIKRLAEKRAKVEAEMKLRRAELEAVFEKVKNHELTMQRSANEQGVLFGGVSQHDIAEALRAEGFPIEERMVRIGQQIKRLDTYHVPLVLANDLKTEIKLWVVSDKPAEELQAEKAEGEQKGEEGGERAERGEGRRGRREKTEDATESPETAGGSASGEPKKKSKKKAEQAEKA